MTTVATSVTLYNMQDEEFVFTFSNGTKIVVFGSVASGGIGTPQYAVSTDSGATWTAPITLPVPMGNCGMRVISDVLWSWTTSGITATASYASFNTGTNRLGSATSSTYTLPDVGTLQNLPRAEWDGGIWHVAFCYTSGQLQKRIGVLSTAGAGSIVASASVPLTWGSILDLQVRTVAGTPVSLFLAVLDSALKTTSVLPLTYNAGVYTMTAASLETARTGANSAQTLAIMLDSANKLDLVIRDGTSLFALKRTGTNAYSGVATIANTVSTSGRHALSYDAGTTALTCYYESTVLVANGEVYSVRRSAGVWGTATLIAGGASSRSRLPAAGRFSTDLTYCTGAEVDYGAVPVSSPPSTPTVTIPAVVPSLTPMLTATTYNVSPNDPLGSTQWQVQHGAGISDWDTGQVTTNNPNTLYAGTALVYGTAYQARTRQYDSISNTASAWSSWVTFTPKNGPVATITSVNDGSAHGSSPMSLGGSVFTVAFTYTQADADAMSACRINLYAADAVTLLQQSAIESVAVANGGSHTSSVSFVLANSTTYNIGVLTTDGTTGVSAVGPLWILNTSWTPPSAPTGLTFTPHPDLGTVVLTWTNVSSPVGNRVRYRVSGTSPWILAYDGPAITSKTLFILPGVSYDYQVTAVNGIGVESS